MQVEIIFTTSNTPKVLEIDAAYGKGGLLCLQLPNGMIVAHPLMHVFSIAYPHGQHVGTTRKENSDG